MQVNADYSITGSAEDLSRAFDTNFEFKGPGFYFTKTDTLLIVPLPPENPATSDNVWHFKQPEGTIYQAYVYNIPFNQTIFAAIAMAPTRQDNRG